MALITTNFTQEYGHQPTGSMLPNGKIATDCISVDGNGNAIGTLASPSITSSLANSLGLQGMSFVASSGQISMTVAGNARVLFSNPTGSGVTAAVSAVCIFSSATAALWPTLFVNPTAGLPTTKGIVSNVLLGGQASKSSIYADNNSTALSGGTPFVPLNVPASGRTVYSQLALYVPPGFSLGINISMLVSTSCEVSFYFSES